MSTTMFVNTDVNVSKSDNLNSPIATINDEVVDKPNFITPAIQGDINIPDTPTKNENSKLSSLNVTPDTSNLDEYIDTEDFNNQMASRNLDEEFANCIDQSDLDDFNNSDESKSSKRVKFVNTPEKLTLTIPNDEEIDDLKSCILASLEINDNYEPIKSDDYPDILTIKDSILGEMNLANCDWGHKEGKIYKPNLYRNERRLMREPLTKQVDIHCLYSFIRSLLQTAFDMELELSEDINEKYYVFNPYNKNVYDKLDEFSKRSSKKEFGIKTRLNKEAANVILTCYYVLYMKFEQTSDEIIFEDLYRECVLMQDSNFDLAKFYDRITHSDNLKSFEALRSIMADCLSLIPMPQEQRILQFNAWTICYSRQTTQVTSKNPNIFNSYLSIVDLLMNYDNEWFDKVIDNEKESHIKDDITNTDICDTNQLTPIDISSSNKVQSTIPNQIDELLNETPNPSNNCVSNEIHSAAPTPTKQKKNSKDIIDKLINGFIGLFTPVKNIENQKTKPV